MSLKIHLHDDYYLTADKYQWMIAKKVSRLRKGAPVEELKPVSYHSNPGHAVRYHAETRLRESDVESIDEAVEYMKNITARLCEALQPHFEVTKHEK